ncbi:nuclear transport factor 2 family protein [Candidatus Gracilibacteria bacterium]|nr:nuclear transport factor 2 family protein [Candidatus Gracilibacteria bacterium]NJM88225.1 nuclear transport factor 2 family protein [Hydrococcus sp. RU_2_2]NJP21386.1 nuclear transport factor 2 family protein [Hydrococcus sp. CRU_1_1]
MKIFKLSRRHLVFLSSMGIAGVANAIASTRSQAQSQTPQNMTSQPALDRLDIIETVNKIGIMADLRDWEACRACFRDRVEFDYTSLMGGKPTIVDANTQIQQWSDFFEKTFKTTQHLIGSHTITLNSDTATCLSNFQAHHVLLDSTKRTWTLGGYYQHELARNTNGWQVTKMKMTWTWEEGTRPF